IAVELRRQRYFREVIVQGTVVVGGKRIPSQGKDLKGGVLAKARSYGRHFIQHNRGGQDAIFVHVSVGTESHGYKTRILRKYFEKACLITLVPHHRASYRLAADIFGDRLSSDCSARSMH